MTRAARFLVLADMQKAHPTLMCHIPNCLACARYYAVLLAPDVEKTP